MTTSFKFDHAWVKSTVEVLADGSLKEVDGWRLKTNANDTEWPGAGTIYHTLDEWVSYMVPRSIWTADDHTYKLSYKTTMADKCSSVVWVPSKKHFMEVRRGAKTTFTDAERQTWTSLTDWCMKMCGGRIAYAYAHVPVKEQAIPVTPEVSTHVPVVDAAFDAVKFKKGSIRRADVVEEKSLWLQHRMYMISTRSIYRRLPPLEGKD